MLGRKAQPRPIIYWVDKLCQRAAVRGVHMAIWTKLCSLPQSDLVGKGGIYPLKEPGGQLSLDVCQMGLYESVNMNINREREVSMAVH